MKYTTFKFLVYIMKFLGRSPLGMSIYIYFLKNLFILFIQQTLCPIKSEIPNVSPEIISWLFKNSSNIRTLPHKRSSTISKTLYTNFRSMSSMTIILFCHIIIITLDNTCFDKLPSFSDT